MATDLVTTTPPARGTSTSRRLFLATAPLAAVIVACRGGKPPAGSGIPATIEQHRLARAEVNAAFKALDNLEFELAYDDFREPQALKYQCATWRGEVGEKVYAYTAADVDAWCDSRPSRIPTIMLADETPEQIRARLHTELRVDASRQDAKRRANGHMAATDRLAAASEAESALHDKILTARPKTTADAHALLIYAAQEFDRGVDHSLCVVARNVASSGALVG